MSRSRILSRLLTSCGAEAAGGRRGLYSPAPAPALQTYEKEAAFKKSIDTETAARTAKVEEKAASSILGSIHKELLAVREAELGEMAVYYFDGEGKFIRPRLAITMANAINKHLQIDDGNVRRLQTQIALISEMWHTSSLLHDDVIDRAEARRGKSSVNLRWGAAKSVLAGDFILAVSSRLLAQTGNPEVVISMSQILADLVNGELQQMMNKEDEADRFQLYLDKSFNKTASLMAYSCKSVALLASGEDKELADMAFMYGRNIGIAFQLVDDWLDFVSTAEQLGKKAGADLELGLATAPVLFASREFPELNTLINRRFSEPEDAQEAFGIVLRSKGLERTQNLATKYSQMAKMGIAGLNDSEGKQELEQLADSVIHRCR